MGGRSGQKSSALRSGSELLEDHVALAEGSMQDEQGARCLRECLDAVEFASIPASQALIRGELPIEILEPCDNLIRRNFTEPK
jgi:hypothetical protein